MTKTYNAITHAARGLRFTGRFFSIVSGVLFSIGLAACANLQGTSPPEGPVRPNIVVVLVDDLGIVDVAPYGEGTFYETPNLERFANRAFVFTHAYAASPVCSPSRYALLTGKHPARADATEWFRRPGAQKRSGTYASANNVEAMALEETTMAEALNELGYRSVFVGKWHLGENPSHWPLAQGFDENIGGYGSGSPRGTPGFFSPYNNPALADGPDGEYLTERLTDEAIARIEESASREEPLFLLLSFYTVHNPLGAPPETVRHFENKRDALELEDSFGEDEQVWPNAKRARRVRTTQSHPTYAAMVKEMDIAFGRVLDALEENDLSKDTIIVFTSDNGGLSTSEGLPTSNLPYRGGKGWIYEGGIRVPLMIAVPNSSRPQNVNEPVSAIDLYPTLMALAGHPTPSSVDVDGVSLAPLLGGEDQSETLNQRPLFWHYPHYSNQGGMPASAVRVGSHKLIRRLEDGRLHLFDLQADASEQRDIAHENPATVERLSEHLERFYSETDAKFLNAKPGGPEPWRPEHMNTDQIDGEDQTR